MPKRDKLSVNSLPGKGTIARLRSNQAGTVIRTTDYGFQIIDVTKDGRNTSMANGDQPEAEDDSTGGQTPG